MMRAKTFPSESQTAYRACSHMPTTLKPNGNSGSNCNRDGSHLLGICITNRFAIVRHKKDALETICLQPCGTRVRQVCSGHNSTCASSRYAYQPPVQIHGLTRVYHICVGLWQCRHYSMSSNACDVRARAGCHTCMHRRFCFVCMF